MEWFFLIALAITMLPIWIYIHEMSHLIAGLRMGFIESWILHLYPHIHCKKFYWGRLEWWTSRQVAPRQRAWTAIAPRYADLVAAIALPFACLLSGSGFWIWTIIWGAGLVDLITGSIGWSEQSDLRKAAAGFNMQPMTFRFFGFLAVVVSVAAWGLFGWGWL